MLEGKRPPGSRVLVLDCEGYFMGAGMAELMRAHGHDVDLLTSCEKVAPMCDETLEGPILRRHLHDLGIGMRAETWVTRIEPGGVACETELGDTFELEADAVVLVTQRVSDEALYLELAGDRGSLRGRLSRGRLRRAAADRRRDLGRAPARARDRLGRPGPAAAAPARAAWARTRPGAGVSGPGPAGRRSEGSVYTRGLGGRSSGGRVQ